MDLSETKHVKITAIILSIILSIIIALIPYYLLIHYVVDVDLQENNEELGRANNLLNFYEQPHDGDIFIIGTSLVNEGIDAYLVEDLLKEKHINRSVYVLGENGDSPLERVTKLDNLIASKPGMVVIGLSYCSLTPDANDIYSDDRFLLRLQGKPINDKYKSLFSEEQLEPSYKTPLERFFDKRKFLFSSVDRYARDKLFKNEKSGRANNLSRYPKSYTSNFKDPWAHTINKTETEKKEELMDTKFRCPISDDLDPQKKALQYITTKLPQNNIKVMIINMPISPYFSNVISESTRHNYSKFLNSTGVPWYDYEREYLSESFTDKWHLNVAGRTGFSPKIAAILINLFMKGE
ncbi:hypothetical protein METP3_03345 [Methanosarcinales archaeon]|nr:hypothetical protein METP3_03345 [Methanosarcinales archaeon]